MVNKNTLKIDILVPLSGQGGVEIVLNELALHLQESGHSVRVVQMVYSGPKWLDDSIHFYPLLVNKKVNHINDFSDMYTRFLLENGVPDIVLATPWPFLSFVARKALTYLNSDAKIISWLHGPLRTYKQYDLGGAECLSFADSIFVLSKKELTNIQTLLPEKQVSIVPNPVDYSNCIDYRTYNPYTNHILFVGRLTEEKRPDIPIKAISLCKTDWKLRIIGDGELKEEIINLSNELNISDTVEFCGWLDNPWKHADEISYLVITSDYESFSLVAQEALYCGIPVISTPVDGVSERIIAGTNGYFVSHDSPKELAEVLDLIATNVLPALNPETCHNMALPYEKEKALVTIENLIIRENNYGN